MSIKVRKFLELSTGHLTVETRVYLTKSLAKGKGPIACHATEHGWFYWVGRDDEELAKLPAELQECTHFARQQECDYILFDIDIELIDGLPDYSEA